MMKTTISRYLAASFILPFLVTLIFTLTFLLTFQMFKIVSLAMNTGVQLKIIFILTGHLIVYTVPIALPLSILFATLFLFNRLSLDSEYTAMRSFGLSKTKIFMPVLLIGLMISVMVNELSKNAIPYSAAEFKNMLAYLTSKGYITSIKEGHFFTDIPGLTLFSEKVTNDGNDLEEVFINFKNSKEDYERVIFAKRGKLIKLNENEIGAASLRLKLFEGNIVKLDRTGNEIEKIIFAEYDFPISSGMMIQGSAVKDSMRSSDELREIINLDIKAQEKRGLELKEIINAKIEYYSRINTAFQCIVFVILGFVLGIQPTRGKARNTGVMTLGVLIIYYLIFFMGVSISRWGKIDPGIIVFLPTAITFILSAYFYRKLDWVS